MRFLVILIGFVVRKLRGAVYWFKFWTNISALDGRLSVGKNIRILVPVRCDGKGAVSIGDGTVLGWPLSVRLGNGEILLQARGESARVAVGRNVAFSNNVSIIAMQSVTIGDDCLVGDSALFMDSDFHEIDPADRRKGSGVTKAITVGRNVWFGSRIIVQKGVTIGDNSIIASQSVVTRDVPPNCIAGGNPAKVIRYFETSN